MLDDNQSPRELAYEEAVAELERIVRRLEQGGSSLEEDLTDYGRAVELIKQCHSRLAVAERKVQLLSGVDAEGKPAVEPFGSDERQDDTPTKGIKAENTGRKRRESTN